MRRVIVSGSTDYRRYQAAALKTKYGIRFPGLFSGLKKGAARAEATCDDSERGETDPDLLYSTVDAPDRL